MTQKGCNIMAVTFSSFGRRTDGTEVTAAEIRHANGFSAVILDYGATVQALRVPNKGGVPVDMVLGYDTVQEYENNGDYLGATIGRVGNRIGRSVFSLNGVTYPLFRNDGENHLHGGLVGFDKCMWNMHEEDGSVVCERLSPDGEEGYPGNLNVRVCFTLSEEGCLSIVYDADTDRDTLVNLTNHSYFNLNGGGSILNHKLQVAAERFCENDSHCLPTGRLLDVEGTPFDFREEKAVGTDIASPYEQTAMVNGYDHNYVLSGRKAAVLFSEESGIEMTCETDMPGMQLYSANSLWERPGKGGIHFMPHYAACLETQLYPNAMNCYGFPSPVLRAGKHLHTETRYSFRIR